MTSQWETELAIHCVLPPSKTTTIIREYFSKTAKLSTPLLQQSRTLGLHATVLTLLSGDSVLDTYCEFSASMKEGDLLEDDFLRIKEMILKTADHVEFHLALVWFLVHMESARDLAVKLGKLNMMN